MLGPGYYKGERTRTLSGVAGRPARPPVSTGARAQRAARAQRGFSSAATDRADVVIVGSGVMGLNIAFQL